MMGAHQQRRGLQSAQSCCGRPRPLRRRQWAAVLTTSYCCSAANDKATAQKQMTEPAWGVCSTTDEHSRVMAEPAADTGEPAAALYSSIYIRPQQFMGKYKGKKSLFFHNVGGKRPKWSADGEPGLPGLKFSALWNYMSGRVPAGLLNIVSQWHNKRQEMEVNAGRNKHASLSLISDIKEKCHRKDFPHNNRIIWATLKSSCLTLNCRGNGSKAKYL